MARTDLSLETPQGGFSFVGRLHGGAPRPSLFVMAGAFPPEGHFHELVDAFPGANVLVGKFTLIARDPVDGLAGFHATLDDFVSRIFGASPLVVFGASTGCLFTLGMKAPAIRRQVALEPFFSTAELWPFIRNARERLANEPDDKGVAKFLWELFGVAPDRIEDRDYRYLLSRLSTPTDVILGEAPLEPSRERELWPSLTSARDRAGLAVHPLVTLHAGPPDSGHAFETVPGGAEIIRDVLVQALRAAARG